MYLDLPQNDEHAVLWRQLKAQCLLHSLLMLKGMIFLRVWTAKLPWWGISISRCKLGSLRLVKNIGVENFRRKHENSMLISTGSQQRSSTAHCLVSERLLRSMMRPVGSHQCRFVQILSDLNDKCELIYVRLLSTTFTANEEDVVILHHW